MCSIERTVRAIEFSFPDRVPMCLSIDHDTDLNTSYDMMINSTYRTDIGIVGNRDLHFVADRVGRNEWGCIWETKGKTMGEVIENPIPNWETYPEWLRSWVPDFSLEERYMKARASRAEFPDRFLLGGIGFMMMNLINFRGYSNFMMDLLLEKRNLEALIEVIYRGAFDQIDWYSRIGIDGIIAWEDWGLQKSLMISPELWREVFKRPMKAMIDHIHRNGMKYVLHTCGYTLDIIEDFIEVGVDVLQLDQQMNMGLKELSRYAGSVCFFNPVDIQYAYRNTDTAAVSSYCKEMFEALSTAEGGFMYKVYSQPESCEIPLELIRSECESFSSLHYEAE